MHKPDQWHRNKGSQRIWLRLLLILMMFSTMVPLSAQAGPSSAGGIKDIKDFLARHHHRRIFPALLDLPRKPARSPHRPDRPIFGNPVNANMVGTHVVDPVDMKILVITADGTESNYPAITSFLSQIGVPYTVYRVINPANGAKTPLTASMLWDGGVHGYYQGVILTTDSLAYYQSSTNSYPSAFTSTEWQTLWTYESTFKIRQVIYDATGFGPETFGLTWPAWNDTQHRLTWQQTAATPVNGTLTAAGQTQFPYLKSSVTVPIGNADTVLATAGTGVNTLLTNSGYALVSTYTNPTDGRENMAITADGAPYLLHSLLLSYGTINWVTKGIFLGERHTYLTAQPDDIGIDDDVWDTQALTDTTGLSIRMTASDLNAVVSWQNGVQGNSNASQFKLEWPFNAGGFSSTEYPGDTLTSAVIANQSKFNWISHTWSHLNLDSATAAQINSELTQNNTWATSPNRFVLNSNYFKDAMIQPDISGLYSSTYFQAAYNYGIRYGISDGSRKPPNSPDNWDNPSPNAGYYRGTNLVNSQTPNTAQKTILIVPRHASNLFYNLYTPAQWVSEYNCYFSYAHMEPGSVCAKSQWKYWQNDLTYSQILDQESSIMLQYLLKWDIDPIMFHQPNTAQYAPGQSLLTDLISATLQKYHSMINLPIASPGLHNLGTKMANRMAYNTSGVTSQIIACGTPNATPSITVKATKAALIPITGVAYGTNKEVYGGQNISYITLAANQSVTLPLTCS